MMGTAADIAAGKVTPQPVPASPVVNSPVFQTEKSPAAPEEEEPPLPDKDPAELRKQYLGYLETFSRQKGDGRTSPLPEVEDFEVEETAEEARFRGYREVDNQLGPRAQRYKDVLTGNVAHDAPPPAPPPSQPAPPPEP